MRTWGAAAVVVVQGAAAAAWCPETRPRVRARKGCGRCTGRWRGGRRIDDEAQERSIGVVCLRHRMTASSAGLVCAAEHCSIEAPHGPTARFYLSGEVETRASAPKLGAGRYK